MIIYVVDDERPALTLLKSVIEKVLPDENPRCFRKSSELLAAAEETAPDMVFMDIEMPGINGIELAEKINIINKDVKIIFVTGYDKYAKEAFDVFASGYIMKPCSKEQMEKVLSKIDIMPKAKKDIMIKTFGNFDIFYKGEPVVFKSAKAKEMLAYLVDREGAQVSRVEMASVIFEDDFSRSAQTRLSQFASKLKKDLEDAGIKDFFFIHNGYRVDMALADCDLVEYLSGKSTKLYTGEYMQQYSWGEYRKEIFE